MSYALIKLIHEAADAGTIKEPFTVSDVTKWMIKHDIRKKDGAPYTSSYPASLLSDSVIKKKKTKNRNSKWLRKCKNKHAEDIYWFE